MIKPNLFIVGAAKSGTTALHNILSKHHNIFMSPVKELNYFCNDIKYHNFRDDYKFDTHYNPDEIKSSMHNVWIDNKEIYFRIFTNAEAKIIGESSPSYLYSQVAGQNIKNMNSNSRIIILLRNPVERAFSHYQMNLQIGYAKNCFMTEFKCDSNKDKKGWGVSHLYKELGMYYEQVKKYYEVFPKSQIHIVIFEDFINDTAKSINEICGFLEVEDNSLTLSADYDRNKSLVPKSSRLVYFLKILSRKIPYLKNLYFKEWLKNTLYTNVKPRLNFEIKEELLPVYINDIKKLEKLIDKDLTSWLI